MAAVNRFTRIQPGNYNPMSLQELMLAPQYKRNQHDKLLEASSVIDTGIAQVNPLAVHNEAARVEQERLSKALQQQVDLLNSEGFNPSSKSQFINLNKDYQRSISPTGTLGRINQAREVLSKNRKDYLDNAIKAGYSPEAALMNWRDFENKYIEDFRQTGQLVPIGQYMAPNYFDYLEEAKDIFKDAGVTAEEIESGGGRIVQDDRGMYVVNSKSKKVNESNIAQLQSAVNFLNNQILNPRSDAYKSIVHQRKAIPDVLKEITGLANVYRTTDSKSSSTSSISNFKTAKDLGIQQEGNLAYETSAASNINRFKDNLNSRLSKIANNENVTILDPSLSPSVKNVNVAVGLGPYSPYKGEDNDDTTRTEKATFQNTLTEEQRIEYDKIYKGLSKTNPQLASIDKYSQEAASYINEYLSTYSDMIHQDIIITDDLVKEYGYSTGVVSKNKKDIFEAIKTGRSSRRYSIDGKEYSYDELPSSVKENFNDLEYSGYLSPKNFKGSDKESDKDLYVSPHRLIEYDEDGDIKNEILVGRSASERQGSDFKADREFNSIYRNTKSLPGIPYEDSNIGAIITYIPERELYELRSKRDSSKVTVMDETTLQSMIYELAKSR
jgi:hypothetical protein